MNNTQFNKPKINPAPYIVSGIISLICIVGLIIFFFRLGVNNKAPVGAEDTQKEQDQTVSAPVSGTRELRGVWIASAINIDFPSETNLTIQQLKSEIDSIVQNTKDAGLNTIFFQVRPTADALYKSSIFPQSKYVSGEQGKASDGDLDCLAYMLQKASECGIDVHAWINPYRVTMYESDNEQLCETSPAVLHPEYTIKYADGKTYFDPGLPAVRKLVIDGVRELVQNYPTLSGIHFDDYFYPYPKGDAEFDDSASYQKYGDGMELSEWRRSNVNALVKETYEAVKQLAPQMRFGISTFGIWANDSNENTPVKGSATNGLQAYSELYCDALAWAKGGYVDYIAPQNYWAFDTKAAPFDAVARWWNANLDGTGVDLYMGHAAYKAQDYTHGELARQVEYCRSLLCYKGSIFYGYSELMENIGGNKELLCELYKSDTYIKDITPTNQAPVVNFPEKNSAVSTSTTYVLGSSDPAMPVSVEGQAVSRTVDGYFDAVIEVPQSKKQILLMQNGKQYTHPINTSLGKKSSYTHKVMDSFEIGSTTPSGSTWVNIGDTLNFGCAAPAGSVVTAVIGGMTVVLQPTINPPDEAPFMYEYYTGKVTPSTFAKDGEIASLGTLYFKAQKGEYTAEKKVGLISQAGKDAYCYVEVAKDYTHTKVGTTSSFYDDFLPSSKGMRDYAVKLEDDFYKLRFGGYVSKDNVTLNYGRKLVLNKLLTTAIEVNSTDFTNNDNNTTDIRFGITENIPVDVDFREGYMRIILYNTDQSIIPQFDVPKNPLISSISGSKHTKENMVIYRVKLKEDKNYYGFNIVYDNGMLIIKLNNPQKLSDNTAKPLSGKTIVVDAGHGGNDIGAPGPDKIPEAVLNYEIAYRLANKLRELGAEVLETRGRDQTSSLYERMDFLNDACPDLAVSIHHNSVASSANAAKTRGFVALYSNNSGVLLAQTVSKTVSTELNRQERSPYYDQLAVARNHRFPSALFEMCFISNIEEYQWSISQGNYERSAIAVANGILDYYEAQEAYLAY